MTPTVQAPGLPAEFLATHKVFRVQEMVRNNLIRAGFQVGKVWITPLTGLPLQLGLLQCGVTVMQNLNGVINMVKATDGTIVEDSVNFNTMLTYTAELAAIVIKLMPVAHHNYGIYDAARNFGHDNIDATLDDAINLWQSALQKGEHAEGPIIPHYLVELCKAAEVGINRALHNGPVVWKSSKTPLIRNALSLLTSGEGKLQGWRLDAIALPVGHPMAKEFEAAGYAQIRNLNLNEAATRHTLTGVL